MNSRIDILKGIHPGLYLAHELKNRRLRSGKFAESIGEHPQTLSAIIRGRRAMNAALSLRIETALGIDEGTLMILQAFYDIEQVKSQMTSNNRPDIFIFRKALFWDTSFDKIDWQKNQAFVINRIFDRGNDAEIREAIRFYGKQTILQNLKTDDKYTPNIQLNAHKYLRYGN